jgi:DNA-binding response OmpR family regulator
MPIAMPSPTVSLDKSVIVAGDAAFLRDRFKMALEGAGYRASTIVTGTNLMAHVRDRASDIDLVVLDLRLPDAPGLDLVRDLRGISRASAPPSSFSAAQSRTPRKSASCRRWGCRAQ